MLLLLKLVGAEKTETAGGLLGIETLIVALEQGEDIIYNNGFEVDFLFIIQILGLQLNLCERVSRQISHGNIAEMRTCDMSTLASGRDA